MDGHTPKRGAALLVGLPRRALNQWAALSRATRAAHLTRWLLAIMLVVGGLILYTAAPTTGTPKAMVEHPLFVARLFVDGMTFYHAYCVFSIVAGVVLAVVRRPSLSLFFVLTSPFLVYVAYTILALKLGIITSLQGAFFYAVLYALLLIMYWGYRDDRGNA